MGSYSLGDVARITGVSRARLRYWERTALLSSEVGEGAGNPYAGRTEFEFRDLVAVRAVLSLLERGVSLRRIRSHVRAAKRALPELSRPLDSLRPWADGSRRVVVRHDGVLVEPEGQLVLDFAATGAEPVELRRAADDCDPTAPTAADWFEQGCKLDTNRATYPEAIEAYQRAIACDPACADAHCNLGSVYFNQDRRDSARDCFLRALEVEPRHVEANLNLATLLEEAGHNQMALRHYRVALDADPLSADTHVSLALLYEKLGLRRKARDYWRRYLQLEPGGTWVEIARQRLRATPDPQ